MRDIESESRFIWKFLWKIMITPFTILWIILGKKEFKELFEPFVMFWRFLFEAKFTIIIIIINIAMYFYSQSLSDAAFASLMSYPKDLLSARAYSLITSGFIHAGISHLLWNMLALFIFGRVVERKLGSGKTFTIYFGALIISGIFTSSISLFITNNNIPGLGASGAIMGLVSAAILLDPLYFTYELIIPLPVMVVGWITIYADITGILNPSADGIGHFAHLGGYLSIALLVFLLEGEDRKKLMKGLVVNIVSLAILGVIYYFSLT